MEILKSRVISTSKSTRITEIEQIEFSNGHKVAKISGVYPPGNIVYVSLGATGVIPIVKKHHSVLEGLIEELFCIPFKELKQYPMNDETTEMLLKLFLSDNQGHKMNIPQAEKPFLYQLIEKRIDGCYQFKIESEQLLLFLCQICQTPGKAIMYLWYFQYYCFTNNIKVLKFEHFINMFPIGFPSDDDLGNLWRNCKSYNVQERLKTSYNIDEEVPFKDNLLDCAIAGKSIYHR